MRPRKGDKIRLRYGDTAGRRAIVERVEGDRLVVRLNGSLTSIHVPAHGVTNLSLAARKAWASMPDRSVGRPKGTKTVNRISVTLRFDRDVWARFVENERRGSIRDRTEIVNAWFRERLDALDDGDR